MAQNQAMLSTAQAAAYNRKYDVSSKVYLLEPWSYPFVTLLTNIGPSISDAVGNYKGAGIRKTKVMDPQFRWLEDTYAEFSSAGVGTPEEGATITVADGTLFSAGDIIRLVTDDTETYVSTATGNTEVCYVISISGDALTVTRAYDTDGDILDIDASAYTVYRLGIAKSEGADAGEAMTTQKSGKYNYTEIFETVVELSETLNATELYTGNEEKYQLRKRAIDHALSIEKQLWFGHRHKVTSGNDVKRTTGGIDELNSTMQAKAGSAAALTETDFIDFLKDSFQYGSNKKYLFCNGGLLAAINSFARGAIRLQQPEPGNTSTYGIAVINYVSPFGEVKLINNPLFDKLGFTTGSAGFLMDLETVEYTYLNGRDTTLTKNIQGNGEDAIKHKFLTECGIKRSNFERNGYISGYAA